MEASGPSRAKAHAEAFDQRLTSFEVHRRSTTSSYEL